MSDNREQLWRWSIVALVLVTCAGLAVDVWVHLDVASRYSGVRTSVVSEADLFRIEAVIAAASGLALIIRPNRLTALIAGVVGLGGALAVAFYVYVDPGQIGPLPNMHEPVWYTEKTYSFWAEAIAGVTAIGLLVVLRLRSRSRLPSQTSVVSQGG